METFSSHYFTANTQIINSSKKLNIDSFVISLEVIDQEISDNIKTVKKLRLPLGYSHTEDFDLKNIPMYASVLAEDLHNFSHDILPGDLVLFSSIAITEIVAICQWIASRPIIPGIHYVLLFCEPPQILAPYHRFQAECVQIVSVCLSLIKDRPDVSLTSQSQTVCQEFENLAGRKVEIISYFQKMEVPPHHPKEFVTFGHIGQPSMNKGIHIVYNVANFILEMHQNTKIILQMHPKLIELWGENPVLSHPRATIFMTPLPFEAYQQVFDNIDVFLMPYEASAYRQTTSSVFLEAMSAGKFVLVTEGSSMADDLPGYGNSGLPIARSEVGLLEGCHTLLGDPEHFLQRGSQARDSYALRQGPDRFVERLQEFYHRAAGLIQG